MTFNFFSCYCINENGEVVIFDSEYNIENEKITDKILVRTVLFQGIKKYPDLTELMPVRSVDDIDCSNCSGTGIEPTAGKLNFICFCGGLGWIL